MRRPALLIVLSAALVGGTWFVVAARREARQPAAVALYHMSVTASNCPTRPLRIAVAGDLHVSAITPPGALAEAVRRINAERPDYVLLVGDYLGHDWPRDSAGVDAAIRPLAALRPRVGTAAVLGNNDWADAPVRIAAALAGAGVHVLGNDAWITPDVVVLGVKDLVTDDANPQQALDRYGAALRAGRATPPPLQFWIAHQPEMLDRMATTGDLLFTGHTHGGQVLPAFTVPVARSVTGMLRALGWGADWPAERYGRGIYRQGGKRMIVTSGLGVSTLPLRLGVPPEVILLSVPSCADAT